MKIAYFSPLNPLKSGISDFSEELIPELSKYIDIDIFVDGYKPCNKYILENIKIFDVKEFDKDYIRDQYNEVVYHIGNNEKCHKNIVNYSLKYSGIVELHDLSLHHMLAATTIAKGNKIDYIKEMEYCHGNYGKVVAERFINGEIEPPWETNSLKFNVNKRILDNCKAIIVHSDFAKQIVKTISKKPVKNILLHASEIGKIPDEYKQSLKKSMNIPMDKFIMASFGFATKSKRIESILQALKRVKNTNPNFIYYIVGQASEELNLKKLITDLNLSDNVVIKGFVDLNEFKKYMQVCDLCLNLRYPTQGETSASLNRLLGMGKTVLVSKIGSFMEYPDNVVIKISTGKDEIDEIYNSMMELMNNKNLRLEIEKNALEFAEKHYSLGKNVMKYKEFLEAIYNGSYYESDIVENLTNKFDELGIYEKKIIDNILNKIFL